MPDTVGNTLLKLERTLSTFPNRKQGPGSGQLLPEKALHSAARPGSAHKPGLSKLPRPASTPSGYSAYISNRKREEAELRASSVVPEPCTTGEMAS